MERRRRLWQKDQTTQHNEASPPLARSSASHSDANLWVEMLVHQTAAIRTSVGRLLADWAHLKLLAWQPSCGDTGQMSSKRSWPRLLARTTRGVSQ